MWVDEENIVLSLLCTIRTWEQETESKNKSKTIANTMWVDEEYRYNQNIFKQYSDKMKE